MRNPERLAWIALLAPVLAIAQNEPAPFTRAPQADERAIGALAAAIAIAAPDDVFAVQMTLERPATLAEVRDAANTLRIPRVMGSVELRIPGVGATSKLPVGLGSLYAERPAAQQQLCRARVFAALSGVDALERTPPERWSIQEIHVYGPAHAVRELQAGTLLPPARVTGGAAQEQRHLQAIGAAVRADLAEGIQAPDDFEPPPGCEPFVRRQDAGVLVSGPAPGPDRTPGNGDFRAPLLARLAALAPATPVSLDLTFDGELGVDAFASLVAQHKIDGLVAELAPPEPSKRMLFELELSVHAGSIADQALRANCRVALGATAASPGRVDPSTTAAWAASRARVSLRADAAAALLSVPDLRRAELTANFPAGELARLGDYYRGRAADRPRIGQATPLPSGCERFFERGP
jgi:hypothetical protein